MARELKLVELGGGRIAIGAWDEVLAGTAPRKVFRRTGLGGCRVRSRQALRRDGYPRQTRWGLPAAGVEANATMPVTVVADPGGHGRALRPETNFWTGPRGSCGRTSLRSLPSLCRRNQAAQQARARHGRGPVTVRWKRNAPRGTGPETETLRGGAASRPRPVPGSFCGFPRAPGTRTRRRGQRPAAGPWERGPEPVRAPQGTAGRRPGASCRDPRSRGTARLSGMQAYFGTKSRALLAIAGAADGDEVD